MKVQVKTSKMRVGPDSRPRAVARIHVEFLQPLITNVEFTDTFKHGWYFPLYARNFTARYPAR